MIIGLSALVGNPALRWWRLTTSTYLADQPARHSITSRSANAEEMTMDFVAVHESVIGTKRTSQDVGPFVRFRGEADLHGPLALPASVVNDPNRT